MVKPRNSSSVNPDNHSKNWTYIIITSIICFTIVIGIAIFTFSTAVYEWLAKNIESYLIGLGTSTTISAMFKRINNLMKDERA